MNYTQLVAAVKSYAENTFPDTLDASGLTSTEQVDTFIRQAEQRVFNAVQLLDLRKNVTGTCTSGNKYLAVPSDWLSNFSMAVVNPSSGEYSYLLNKDVNYIRAAFPNPATTGTPTHYAFFDDTTFILGPTPDAAYAVELHYFYYPQSIVDATSSWLGDNFDAVLLYGTLLEAVTFMKEEADVLKQVQARYDEAMALLKQLGEGKNRQDNYRTQQTRQPVR